MKRKDRFITKDSFFYALVIVATLAVTGAGALIELVEHAGVFAGYTVEARHASAAEAVRSKRHAIYVAKAGEKK
jgi:hypothetical protein